MDNYGSVQRPAGKPTGSHEQQQGDNGFLHYDPKTDGVRISIGPALEQGEHFSPHDNLFTRFNAVFSDSVRALPYNATAFYILHSTGLRLIPWIPPTTKNKKRLVFTKTKRLFEFQAPLIPIMGTTSLGNGERKVTHEIGSVINGSFYNTFNATPGDERIRALAYYIIQRYDAHSVTEVINALAFWVSCNIRLFKDLDKIAQAIKKDKVHVATEELASKLEVRVNHSFTNGIEIIRKGGLCYDFANLLTDLLNSVGIPARPVLATWLEVEPKGSGTKAENNAHSLVHVYVPDSDDLYLDAMPVRFIDGISGMVKSANNATELIHNFITLNNPNRHVLNMQITDAMPTEFVTPELRELLEEYPVTYTSHPKFLEMFYEFLAKYGDDYWIHFTQNL